MFLIEGILHPFFKLFLLESQDNVNLKSFMIAGIFGTMLHVLLDSPLYTDIRPFFPLTINPLHNPALTFEIYGFCVWMGILGIIYYVSLLVFTVYGRVRKG
jgi:hypothetical protein